MEFNSGFKGLNMLHTLRFSLQNDVYFIMLHFLVPVLFTQDLSRRAAAGRSPAEIVGSNPTGGMDICLL